MRQRGVAIITALLLTSLAVTIVASLFWQQQVQVRSMENQRLNLQTKWILLGALDFARMILNADARNSNIDHLGEIWAGGLAETRLDDYVDKQPNDTETTDAALSGKIVDATARYNLTNLAWNRVVDPAELVVFRKLLINLRLDPQLANATALALARTQKVAVVAPGATGTGTGATPTAPGVAAVAGTEPTPFTQIEDLLTVPGFTAPMINSLQDYVIFLPRLSANLTTVNLNTASAEVLSARIDKLALSDAQRLVAVRERVHYFNDLNDVNLNVIPLPANKPGLDVKSSYFIATAKVHLDRAWLETRALIQRNANGAGPSSQFIWIREN
jgi:general secretion pathway protein K